ncbi:MULTISPECIES: hypothetical protein [Nonlabens]|uniref:Transcription factor zinc-finger domain-containing protein n=1 Tax=Nonlabens ulvanivorans TaxID=906888 RepID=A0A081DFW0_NONUL|nr:hypothetical protein [Nonlabens ulvanivorans]WOI23746.1 hypothetical protein R1T42_04645 [Nonlabens ulvanivorans]GAK77806.1 hypothetical protein JCM19296_3415 [Nonlabens ulvanivorans]
MINDIPCIKCDTPIAVDTELYLKGQTFTCSKCDTILGINEPTDVDAQKLKELKLFTKSKKVNETTIPCPDCGTIISFKTKDLTAGKAMTCAACNASVSLQG